jgi:hypothetical protein
MLRTSTIIFITKIMVEALKMNYRSDAPGAQAAVRIVIVRDVPSSYLYTQTLFR